MPIAGCSARHIRGPSTLIARAPKRAVQFRLHKILDEPRTRSRITASIGSNQAAPRNSGRRSFNHFRDGTGGSGQKV